MPRIVALTGNRPLNGQERVNLLVMATMKAQGCKILAKFNERSAFRKLPKEAGKEGVYCIEALTAGAHLEYNLVFRASDLRGMIQLDRKWHVAGSAAYWSRRSTKSILREKEELL